MRRAAGRDDLLDAIGTIHAAGVDAALWPQALAAVTRVVGGIAATLEVFDRKRPALAEFYSFGLPPAHELAYLDRFAALNPRIPALINGRPGSLVTDYTVLDEGGMNRDPFYAGFLAPVGYRYFLGGILTVTDKESSLFSVQRAARQGHVEGDGMARMRALLPHVRGAFEVTRRLRHAQGRTDALERTLDWLTDAVALLRRDGRVLYCNEAFDTIARRADGVRIVKGAVEFAAPPAPARFAAALAAAARPADGGPGATPCADFPAPRAAGAPAYIVSLRPLGEPRTVARDDDAAAIMFVRDPLGRNPAATGLLRDLYRLTAAEANLALAIQAGLSLPDYARQAGVSLNTVYTHLRRIKDKTGCRRMAELNRLLRELQVPLRLG